MRLLKLFILVLSLAVPSFSIAKNVYVEPYAKLIDNTIAVPAGRYIYYQLNLESGSTLLAKFNVAGGFDNRINVWLLDFNNYNLFRANRKYSYYKGTSGTVKGVAGYKFKIPRANTYYLVIDNRRALLLKRIVYLYVYKRTEHEPQKIKIKREAYEKLYGGLKRLFRFKDFKIFVRHCGMENAFSDPNITMCVELDNSLTRQRLPGAYIYVFFHETGHTLLKLWGYPLYDNEDAADEFAAVMTILLKIENTALSAAKWWSKPISRRVALSKIWVDDRHTISPQRARNIVRWLNTKNKLMRRWFKVLAPNMTNEALNAVLQLKEPWVNRELIRNELSRRKSSPTHADSRETIKTKLREAISLTAALKTAIDIAISEGSTLGNIPKNPTALGLAQPEKYRTKYVNSITHDTTGRIIIILQTIPELGDASGKSIIIVPRKNGSTLRWFISKSSTVPSHLLPN